MRIVFLHIIALTIIGHSPLYAQDVLKEYFESIQKGNKKILPKSQYNSWYKDAEIISDLQPYIQQAEVQYDAVKLLTHIAKHHQIKDSRTEAINLLLEVAKNAPSKPNSLISSSLKRHDLNDFDERAKAHLKQLLVLQTPYLSDYIMLAGFLQMRGELISFKNQAGDLPNSLNQSYNLALVRCGDDQKLNEMMSNVASLAIHDNFVYQVAPLLIYVRQNKAIDYLMKIVLSNEKDCSPASAEASGQIICAYRIIEMLAPVINNFPVSVNATTGDLEVEDYPKALGIVRDWIEANTGKYTLNPNIY
ncbi:MAG: hypothetical protein MI974_26160 [Chitinophagales bacterium]|nr:hypothetical protein [Chitinophagales bacterium]